MDLFLYLQPGASPEEASLTHGEMAFKEAGRYTMERGLQSTR
jgi:hypothetical protein